MADQEFIKTQKTVVTGKSHKYKSLCENVFHAVELQVWNERTQRWEGQGRSVRDNEFKFRVVCGEVESVNDDSVVQ